MATVTGATAEWVQTIEDRLIKSAVRSGNDIVFKLSDDVTEIRLVGATAAAYNNWPVDSIFMSTSATNPSILLGGGSWQRWGKGRMPVGVDEDQAEFDAVQEVGGSKTHTLSVNEMPAHNHGGQSGGQSQSHKHAATTDSKGAHTHTGNAEAAGGHQHITQRVDNGTSAPVPGMKTGDTSTMSAYKAQLESVDTSTSGTHVHSLSVNSAGAHTHEVNMQDTATDHTHPIQSQGAGVAHNNLPPYITVYMWRRTA